MGCKGMLFKLKFPLILKYFRIFRQKSGAKLVKYATNKNACILFYCITN